MRSLSARARAERFPEEDAVDDREREKKPMVNASGDGATPEGATGREPHDREESTTHARPIGPLVVYEGVDHPNAQNRRRAARY